MYGWIIDQDYLEPGSVEEGTIGPSTIPPDITEKLREGHGREFRLFDDDGELYYSGRILGDDWDGFEPLDDFGEPNAGCTEVRFFENGRWIRV